MSLLGLLLEKLKSFWELACHRLAGLISQRQTPLTEQPASVVDMAQAREQARAAWVAQVRKRAPHLLHRLHRHPQPVQVVRARLQPASKMAPWQPEPRPAPLTKRAIDQRVSEAASQRASMPSPAAPSVPGDVSPTGPSAGSVPATALPDGGQVEEPLGAHGLSALQADNELPAENRTDSLFDQTCEPSADVSRDRPAKPVQNFLERMVVEQMWKAHRRSLQDAPILPASMEVTPSSPAAAGPLAEVAVCDDPFESTIIGKAEGKARASFPEATGGLRGQAWPSLDWTPRAWTRATTRTDARETPTAVSEPQFGAAETGSAFLCETFGEVRLPEQEPDFAIAEGRWPSLLPDRQPDMNPAPRSVWNEIAYRHRLSGEQRGQ